jgi:hypothetical protein
MRFADPWNGTSKVFVPNLFFYNYTEGEISRNLCYTKMDINSMKACNFIQTMKFLDVFLRPNKTSCQFRSCLQTSTAFGTIFPSDNEEGMN